MTARRYGKGRHKEGKEEEKREKQGKGRVGREGMWNGKAKKEKRTC